MKSSISMPSPFLVENIDILPPLGRALDVAMGNGRNAIYLAQQGLEVEGIDISVELVESATNSASALGVSLNAKVADLENDFHFEKSTYDLIMCFNYLHRPLISQMKQGLRVGGIIVYETFIVDQAQFGRPRNPDHLLEHNELLKMFKEFRCLRYREGVFPGPKAIAGIVAQKT